MLKQPPVGRYPVCRGQRHCLAKAAPEDVAVETAESVTPSSKQPSTTETTAALPLEARSHWRSYPLEAMAQPAHGTPNPPVALGGAVAVLMLGALASSLKLTFGSAHQRTQPLLPTSQKSIYDVNSIDASTTSSGRQRGHARQPWWSADTVFLVTEAPDPQHAASASPVLIRTTHGEILAVFETEATAAQLIEKLKSWGQLVTGAADGGSAAPSGHFRVAALMPRALNIQNVPPTVLIRESQMTQSSLASPEAWQEVVTAAAPEQLRAWQEHIDACLAPDIQADASDVAPTTNMQPPTQVESTSPPDALKNSTQQEIEPFSDTRESMPAMGVGVEPHSDWRRQSSQTDSANAPKAGEGSAAQATQKQPECSPAGNSWRSSVQPDVHGASHNSASTAGPVDDAKLEDMEPTVYSCVEEMEEAERSARGSESDEEPLRLLSEEETDASLVHRNYSSLPVVFAPMLFRAVNANGGLLGGDSDDTEKMLFTVDTTLDEGDPDIVALVFEDPVDANALLSMLAHVRGFRDPDAVTRRVVPMPVGAARDAADGQGASVLCMAKGFRKKAEVRAGKEIDGLLSKIAGARWASLVDAQLVS